MHLRHAILAGFIALSAVTATHAQSNDLSEGEIRKIDKDARKLTIRHGPLKNLDMPAMTMVFAVRDDGMLDGVQTGEKVGFVAERVDGTLVVTHIEAAQAK